MLAAMTVTRGFQGRRRRQDDRVPPGQYVVEDFPVLSAGPTPRVDTDGWRLSVVAADGAERSWSWTEFNALPMEEITVDLHCVTRWSKLGTAWAGVSLDRLLDGVVGTAEFALIESYGGYTTNLALADLLGHKAWVASRYDGHDLAAEHGGPARLLVPHLYLWKSAKWVRSIRLRGVDRPGFWESLGYHNRGDPWQEQRYWDR
jgi:DMSO/TMAO reductase YedYZ molybdopterin-dependent catalytic subunit